MTAIQLLVLIAIFLMASVISVITGHISLSLSNFWLQRIYLTVVSILAFVTPQISTIRSLKLDKEGG